MATHIERLWYPDDAAGLGRRDQRPGRYLAYVPDELGTDLPRLGATAADAADDALAVLARADERIGPGGRYLNHLLIRSESISSSWIEGNRISPKRLAIAELSAHGSRVALDVVANVRATEAAIDELSDPARPVSSLDIERLANLIEPGLPRGFRTEQNWVGGAGLSPLRADFVPPPETEVARLVHDLARFITETGGHPVVRAAIAHAQFETIHPFLDGNGRTGRALIHTVLRRTDAVRHTVIPISTVFASHTDAYLAGLTAYRRDPVDLDTWVIGFSEAAQRAASNAVLLADDVARLDSALLDELVEFRASRGRAPAVPRSDAVVRRILAALGSEPVVTVAGVAGRFGVSTAAAHRALVELADSGILGRTKDQRGRLIAWTADRHLALAALTERSNRAGGAETSARRPSAGPPMPATRDVGRLRGIRDDDPE